MSANQKRRMTESGYAPVVRLAQMLDRAIVALRAQGCREAKRHRRLLLSSKYARELQLGYRHVSTLAPLRSEVSFAFVAACRLVAADRCGTQLEIRRCGMATVRSGAGAVRLR